MVISLGNLKMYGCITMLFSMLLATIPVVEVHPVLKARKVINYGITQADGSVEKHGVYHAASLRCHRFVLFAHSGHGGNHLAKVLDHHPEISMLYNPFGDGLEAVQKGMQFDSEAMKTKTIRLWMEDVFTFAAKKKLFDDVNPPRCAVGIKITDSERGGMDTARMLAEHPSVIKIILERRNVTAEYEEHMKTVTEEEEDKADHSRKGLLQRKVAREEEALNALPKYPHGPIARPKNIGRRLLQTLNPSDFSRLSWDYVNLHEKKVPHKCRVLNCTNIEYYSYHREFFDTVKERLITSGATWMEINTEETMDTCTFPKVLERIFLHLGVTPETKNINDCSMYLEVKHKCPMVEQPHSDTCGRGNLGRIVGHDVPRWAVGW
mmetsp:Transcript_32505/g.45080  ORF Transcript_32505/g.45080 Transcript_32505/m.45080 type:complete len:379 (+) Transcript_32505:74-1210(+)